MSEVRRRKNTNDSEGLSETSFEEIKKVSDSETDNNELSTLDCPDSEYETVEESGSESDDTDHVPSNRNSSLDLSDKEDANDESVILDLERQSGDGEEDSEKKKVDDDEDKSNPQYIPKRGTFYEHDDRTAEDGIPDGAEAKTVDTEQEEIPINEKATGKPKKVWQQSQDRWSHDRYDEGEQAPKSRSELIAAYGYDIRNEEGPPKARRGHRYGHGPNKYTRNWEDLEAYGKQKPTQRKPKAEDFPALQYEKGSSYNNDVSEHSDKKKVEERGSSRIKRNKQNNVRNRNNRFNKFDRRDKQTNEYNENSQKGYNEIKENTNNINENDPKHKKYDNERHQHNSGDKRGPNRPFKNRNTLEFKSHNRNKISNTQHSNSHNSSDGPINNHYELASTIEAQKNLYDIQDKEDNTDNIITQSFNNTKLKCEDSVNSIKYMDNIKTTSHNKSIAQPSGNDHIRGGNVAPPRMQDVVRPKRYSCQRPGGIVPETNMQGQPQQQQPVYQQNYYATEYTPPVANEQNNSHQGQHIPQALNGMPQPGGQVVPPNISVPPPQTMPYVPEPVPTQVITTSNQVMPQQVLAPQYPPSSMQFNSGGPYMAPNNTFIPQSLGYPVPPPQHAPPTQYPPQYPQYPAPTAFNAVPNPPPAGPMFQPQGGITYYSPQGQPLPPRLAPRRPRSSAIPIVPPPQVTQENSSPTPDQTSDNDGVHNIDHILDNMFVQRHPYDPSTSNNLCNINEKVQEMSITETSNDETHIQNSTNEIENTSNENAQTNSVETCESNDILPVAT